MAKFNMGVLPTQPPVTARLGSAATAEGRMADTELFKFVKLAGESRYDLCAAGDQIEGQIVAREPATQDGYTIGSVLQSGFINAICDGLEATAGTGTIAVGDYVVCGTITAKGTALPTTIPAPKVCKATNQPGGTIDVSGTVNQTTVNAALAKAADAALNAVYAWRVVSLGDAGAVGDTCVIQRVSQL